MFENNVFEGSDQAFYISGLKSITADYNIYANLNGGNPYFIALSYGGNSFSAWQSSCSCDSHSQAQLTSALADFTSEGIPIAGFVGLKDQWIKLYQRRRRKFLNPQHRHYGGS